MNIDLNNKNNICDKIILLFNYFINNFYNFIINFYELNNDDYINYDHINYDYIDESVYYNIGRSLLEDSYEVLPEISSENYIDKNL